MDPLQFIENKLHELLNKLSLEKNKKIFLTGDYNFDLLKTSSHIDTSNFYEKLCSNLLFPLITLPTKINEKNNTLIDNIFTNQFNPETISGNITVNISDHLPSFFVMPKSNQNHLPKKHNIFVRDKNNFDRADFIMDILGIDWASVVCEGDVNTSFNLLLDSVNKVVDKHMPLKRLTNKEFKRKFKPWITTGILKSISRKNTLFNKYSKSKNEINKQIIFNEYKLLRNQLNELIRISKKTYYERFFAEHNSNIKKVWEGIKELVNTKSKNSNYPTCIEINKNISTDQEAICNSFNDFFTNVADKILSERKYDGNKQFTEYLKNPIPNSFAFEPCDATEVKKLIDQLSIE